MTGRNIGFQGGIHAITARIAAVILVFFILLTGCTKGSEPENTDDPPELKVSDYFPVRADVSYVFEGQGNEFASYRVYNDFTSENKIQQRIDNGGTVLVRVIEIKDGAAAEVFFRGEVYYRENMLQKKDDIREVLLMEPIEKGTSWELDNGSQRTITGTNTKIKTSMGTYPCIEVITEAKDSTTIDYYAKDIGLVKTITQSGTMEVSSTLKATEKNTALNQQVRFYYPDIAEGRIYYIERQAAFYTNDNTAEILENEYKTAVNEVYGIELSTEAAVKSLFLDEQNKVRLDLNDEFSSEQAFGAPNERMVLQCVADTFGGYYGSGEVIITVEGEPYRSELIKMQENEPITVNLEGIAEKEPEQTEP